MISIFSWYKSHFMTNTWTSWWWGIQELRTVQLWMLLQASPFLTLGTPPCSGILALTAGETRLLDTTEASAWVIFYYPLPSAKHSFLTYTEIVLLDFFFKPMFRKTTSGLWREASRMQWRSLPHFTLHPFPAAFSWGSPGKLSVPWINSAGQLPLPECSHLCQHTLKRVIHPPLSLKCLIWDFWGEFLWLSCNWSKIEHCCQSSTNYAGILVGWLKDWRNTYQLGP